MLVFQIKDFSGKNKSKLYRKWCFHSCRVRGWIRVGLVCYDSGHDMKSQMKLQVLDKYLSKEGRRNEVHDFMGRGQGGQLQASPGEQLTTQPSALSFCSFLSWCL